MMNTASTPGTPGRLGCFCCPPLAGGSLLAAMNAATRRGSAGASRASSKTKGKAKSRARPAAPNPRRIDVHHHIAPAVYVKSVGAERAFAASWTPSVALEDISRPFARPVSAEESSAVLDVYFA